MKIEKENGYIIYNVDDVNDDEFVIEMVETYEHGKGTASELINEVISIAEAKEKKLSLCACPQDDTVDIETLIAIYSHLDFADGYMALMSYR